MRLPRAWLFGLLVALSTAAAAGEPESSGPAQAQTLMQEGIALEQSADLEGALAKYEAARALVPDASLPHRHAAEVLRRLERWGPAVQAYEAYLRTRPDAPDKERVRELVATIRSQHLQALVDVSCSPNGGELVLDLELEPRGKLPLSAVRMSAGRHTFRVRLRGYREQVFTRDVAAGASAVHCKFEREASKNKVTSRPRPADTQPARPPSGSADGSGGWWKSPWLWVGVGVVIAGATTTAILVGRDRGDLPESRGGSHAFP